LAESSFSAKAGVDIKDVDSIAVAAIVVNSLVAWSKKLFSLKGPDNDKWSGTCDDTRDCRVRVADDECEGAKASVVVE
jgi:hypothetical protein